MATKTRQRAPTLKAGQRTLATTLHSIDEPQRIRLFGAPDAANSRLKTKYIEVSLFFFLFL